MPYKDKEVAKLRKKQWRLDNLERIRVQRKASYHADSERCREKARAWHHANRDRAIAQSKAYRAQHLDVLKQRSRERHLVNLERDRARSKAWDLANREHVSELAKAWRKANPDRDRESHKAWAAKHPERRRALSWRSKQKRRSAERGAFVEYVDRDVVFQRAKGKCGICKRKVDCKSRWHVDHVVPLSQGGTHCYDNVQLAHARCNISKGAKCFVKQPTLFQVVVNA